MDNNLNLVSPWVDFFREINTMFAADKDVKVDLYKTDADNVYVIKLFVNGNDKAEALEKLLIKEKVFGEITVRVEVIPSNPISKASVKKLFENAFKDNYALSYVESCENIFGIFNYVVFSKEVAQYKNDDIGDIHGVKSTLYQEIAKDIFNDEYAVCYCTDIE